MTVDVLTGKDQIRAARARLSGRGLSFTKPRLPARLAARLFPGSMRVGDWIKSWDVEKTLNFIEENLPHDSLIVDHGCYCSEMLPILHRAGYRRLTGLDLNNQVGEMPFADDIDYRVENFMQSSLASESADAVTSISVMEHGFDQAALVSELSRVIKPGGFFVASFDYWPSKLDTGSTTFFGLDWKIFSREELEEFIRAMGAEGFDLCGAPNFDAPESPIRTAGFEYTFAWLALRKVS